MRIYLLLLFFISYCSGKCYETKYLKVDTRAEEYFKNVYSLDNKPFLSAGFFSNFTIKDNRDIYNFKCHTWGNVYDLVNNSQEHHRAVEIILTGTIKEKSKKIIKGYGTFSILFKWTNNLRNFSVNASLNILEKDNNFDIIGIKADGQIINSIKLDDSNIITVNSEINLSSLNIKRNKINYDKKDLSFNSSTFVIPNVFSNNKIYNFSKLKNYISRNVCDE